MPVAEPGGGRNCGLDRVDELAGALERLLAPAPRDRTCDRLCISLLAVLAEDVRQLAFGRFVDELAGRIVRRGIHPHVERGVGGVRETALGTIDLHRRDTEVEEDRISAGAV